MTMNKNIVFLLLLILAGCSSEQPESQKETGRQEPPMAPQLSMEQSQSQSPFTSVTAQAAQQLITDKAGLLILDTRTTNEILSNGAIAGSQQASLRAIFQDQLTVAKDTPILVVCAVGGRSFAAGKIMIQHGFTEIYNLRGGLDEWKAAGLPVIYPKM
ncbi:MAG: rhodanese-like domain-containing protein [Proteobacteria bacterium]|nr:rhodanese-like domain-containing protein [Pseudomonadota bacterium]